MADLIDRQEAIKALCKAGCDSGHCGVSCDDVKAIEDLPSADAVSVRYGHWEECEVLDENCVEVCQSARCSICGRYHTTPYMYYFDQYKYCPNCGARMDGEQHE